MVFIKFFDILKGLKHSLILDTYSKNSMAKKSSKRPARPKKDNAGCMTGLISMFDFRQGRYTRKLIPDRKHESGRHAGERLNLILVG